MFSIYIYYTHMLFLTHLLSGNCTPQIQHWIFDPWNENLQTDAGLIFDVIKGLPTSTQLSGAGWIGLPKTMRIYIKLVMRIQI